MHTLYLHRYSVPSWSCFLLDGLGISKKRREDKRKRNDEKKSKPQGRVQTLDEADPRHTL